MDNAVSYREPRNPVKERCGVALPRPSLFFFVRFPMAFGPNKERRDDFLPDKTKKILAVILLLAVAAAVALIYQLYGPQAQKRAELERRKAARQAQATAALTEETPDARLLSLRPDGGKIEFE